MRQNSEQGRCVFERTAKTLDLARWMAGQRPSSCDAELRNSRRPRTGIALGDCGNGQRQVVHSGFSSGRGSRTCKTPRNGSHTSTGENQHATTSVQKYNSCRSQRDATGPAPAAAAQSKEHERAISVSTRNDAFGKHRGTSARCCRNNFRTAIRRLLAIAVTMLLGALFIALQLWAARKP